MPAGSNTRPLMVVRAVPVHTGRWHSRPVQGPPPPPEPTRPQTPGVPLPPQVSPVGQPPQSSEPPQPLPMVPQYLPPVCWQTSGVQLPLGAQTPGR